MRYNIAKKLKNGDKIIVEMTDKTKTVVKATECVGKMGQACVVILCDDGTAYYDFEVRCAR